MTSVSAPGRRPITSRADLERIAFDLFEANGFDLTTVDDIAAAAGIGRRTFFRYFRSKQDVVWGDFTAHVDRMRARLCDLPTGLALMDALRIAVVDFNRVEPDDLAWHRRRMRLILGEPALRASSEPRFAAWRGAVAGFAASRTGQPPDALASQVVAHAVLGVAIAAYEQWLDRPNADLGALLDSGMRELARAFARASPQPSH